MQHTRPCKSWKSRSRFAKNRGGSQIFVGEAVGSSGLQGAAMLDAARDESGESEALVAEMDAVANACMPVAAAALAEVVARKA